MPPMPTPLCTAGGSFFFGVSATMAIMRPATDAASCGATRTPSPGRRCRRSACRHIARSGRRTRRSETCSQAPCWRRSNPPRPSFQRSGGFGDSSALSTMLMPALSPLSFRIAALAATARRRRAQCLPTAALVACIASSTRSFFSLTSTSVEPPPRITATPPANLACRSCGFSLS
jgi:hypothetical protein